jgi:hypothetical protein
MEKDQLGFSCPHCGIDLVLPLSASGVEGPCPRCRAIIRAPKIVEPEEPPKPVRLEVPVVETPLPRARPVTAFQPTVPQAMPEAPRSGNGKWVIAGMALVALGGLAAVLFVIQVVRQLPDAKAKVFPQAKAPVTAKSNVSAPKPAIPPELDPSVPPEGMDVTVLVTRSADVLGKFLAARSLGERLPFIETQTPEEELVSGLLAKPLAYATSFRSREVRFNKLEGASDVIFAVPLGSDSAAPDVHLIVVRTRGTREPKVLIDPFLDGYGGRLAEFAAYPVEGERTFRGIMTVFDFCTDETVPEHQGKFTVKLSSHPGGKDTAKAYFSANSPLAAKFPGSLTYGRSMGATVVLRWVRGERPFIEVVDIKSLSWDD